MFEDRNLKPDTKLDVADSSNPHLPNCFQDLNYPEETPHYTGKIHCAPILQDGCIPVKPSKLQFSMIQFFSPRYMWRGVRKRNCSLNIYVLCGLCTAILFELWSEEKRLLS